MTLEQEELNKKVGQLASKLGSLRGELTAINNDPLDQHEDLKGEFEHHIDALEETVDFLIDDVFDSGGGESRLSKEYEGMTGSEIVDEVSREANSDETDTAVPDAWRVVSEIDTESDTVHNSKHDAEMNCMSRHPESVEPLFGVSTIRDTIEKHSVERWVCQKCGMVLISVANERDKKRHNRNHHRDGEGPDFEKERMIFLRGSFDEVFDQ